jgi:M6 family metalloprotease-like protein
VAALSNEVTDWSPYDWDGDGYVDQLVIVFAGKGQNDGGGSNSIWANQCWMTAYGEEPVKVSDGKDGTLLLDTYCCVPELDGRNTYGSFGTFCHEYSHCIGLPDFYYGYNNFLYKWDIMDSGNYNLNGYCPPCYSTHERICMGWLDAVELNEAATISGMQPADSHQECYLVRNDEQPDEFYIVENRRQQGWDRSLPGSGVLIFHVRYDEGIWRKGVPNNLSEQRYTIVKANNSSKYKDWAYPYLGNDSLTANSLPASIIPTKSITNIRVADNGTASFDFMGGLPTEAKGDLNGDGIVNALDIQLEINAAVEGYADAKYDMNGDGTVNALDIQEVINLAVHFNESEL